MNIEEILRRNDIFPKDWCNDKWFIAIIDVIRRHERSGRKPRFQILAARFDQEIDHADTRKIIESGWSQGGVNRVHHNGWWQPWRVRATSGRSEFKFARPAELWNMLIPIMSGKPGGSYHVTRTSTLDSIFSQVGCAQRNEQRLAIHFGNQDRIF